LQQRKPQLLRPQQNPKKPTKPKKKLPRVDWRAFLPAPIIGVDEVGRGCLAGPVVAAAVILQSDRHLSQLTDSKLLSEVRRETLFEKIVADHRVAVGFATAAEVDEINVLQASFLAMRRALEKLSENTNEELGHILVDGHLTIPKLPGYHQTALVKGDLRCKPISAASIVAKVTRDRWMRQLAKDYPDYGFEIHKGYPTERHRAAIERCGVINEHRRTFRGVVIEDGEIIGVDGEPMAEQEWMVD
jgi:ribonuclease HII